MARKLTGTLTLALALGLTGFVSAQAQGQPNPILGIGSMLFAPPIQKELRLSDEQVGKLKDGLEKVMAKYKGDFEKFQKAPPSPEQAEKTGKAFHDDSRKAIAGVLDAKQMKRFNQILWQAAGVNALLEPELQKELRLSEEQKKKVADVLKESGKKSHDLAVRGERAKEKYEAVEKEAEEKTNAVLSEEQRKNYKELKGEKFDFAPLAAPPPAKKP